MYSGLLNYGFVTLRRNIFHLILEHVQYRKLCFTYHMYVFLERITVETHKSLVPAKFFMKGFLSKTF